MADIVTREDLLARVQRLAPAIREYADAGERERHLADPVVHALQDAGFYRLLVPRALGGLQASRTHISSTLVASSSVAAIPIPYCISHNAPAKRGA
jgi:hypothetical protein